MRRISRLAAKPVSFWRRTLLHGASISKASFYVPSSSTTYRILRIAVAHRPSWAVAFPPTQTQIGQSAAFRGVSLFSCIICILKHCRMGIFQILCGCKYDVTLPELHRTELPIWMAVATAEHNELPVFISVSHSNCSTIRHTFRE